MTYILGARCKDGIALISDRKGSGWNPTYDENKLTQILPGVIYGGAGDACLIERFSDEITDWVNNDDDIKNWTQLLDFAERKSLEFSDKYERLEGFDILLSVQANPSKLYNIDTETGFACPVKKHISIGSGSDHGILLLEKLWDENMNMEDFAKLGYFLIKYVIKMKLDDDVGGEPTVWFIPDIIYEEIKATDKDKRNAEIEEKFPVDTAKETQIKEIEEYSEKKILIIKDCLEEDMKYGSRKFHIEIQKHYGKQFLKENYTGSVNECTKAFEKYVQKKAKSSKSGRSLMQEAFSIDGKLKLNSQTTETEKNQQIGLQLSCEGLIAGIRNPVAHETEKEHRLDKQEALDILGHISYLYKQVDKCEYNT